MTYKKFAKLRRELCRRVWLKETGSLKGFGKSDRAMIHYHVDFDHWHNITSYADNINSYQECWDILFADLRKSVKM